MGFPYLYAIIREEIHKRIIEYLGHYDPVRISLFGSFARGDEAKASGLALLVSFRQPMGRIRLVRMQKELSALLGRKVNLQTESALEDEDMKDDILRDLQTIYK